VYNAALLTKKLDWNASQARYSGPLTRESLLAALNARHEELLKILETIDTAIQIDAGKKIYSFSEFTWEYTQHEAIHHGQWSVYASIGGFETPLSWRRSWGL
jgi:hypothetical protein